MRMTITLVFLCMSCITSAHAADPDIRGAWRPELYRMKDGAEHPVTGYIFFTEKDWTVLFFIMDGAEPQRGSGEGGTYTLDGDKLVFRHLYHLTNGKMVEGVPAQDSAAAMRVRRADANDAPEEACTIDLKENELTIHFPSGNLLKFRRSSGF